MDPFFTCQSQLSLDTPITNNNPALKSQQKELAKRMALSWFNEKGNCCDKINCSFLKKDGCYHQLVRQKSGNWSLETKGQIS